MRSPLLALTALAAAAAISPASALAENEPGLTLSPTRTDATATKGRILGPFTLRNATQFTYDVGVAPVLLSQARTGEVVVEDGPRAREAAARALRLQTRTFVLPALGARSVAGVVRRAKADHGLYAGVLFTGRPRGDETTGSRVVNALRLNAIQILDPRDAHRAFATEDLRAEQAGPRRIRLVTPVVNRGNAVARVRGTIVVRDEGGSVVARSRFRRTGILPGVTVDIGAPLTERLEAGHYAVETTVTDGPRTRHARGAMELFGVNEVRTEAARLTAFPTPDLERGRPAAVEARFDNTGNVPYAPVAVVQARRVARDGAVGAVVATRTLDVARTAPGQEGKISGELELPTGETFELTTRLMAGDRVLDERAVRAVVHARPSLLERLQELLRANALLIVPALLAFCLAAAAAGIAYVRRLKARLAASAR